MENLLKNFENRESEESFEKRKQISKIQFQHLVKVNTYIEIGVDKIRVFEEDYQFENWTNTGFMDFLFENYEHECKFGGSCFIFDLLKPLK